MIDRPFWRQRIEDAWRDVPIAWLCGMRRCGKTTPARSFGPERVTFVNCDLPSAEDMVRDPQVFFCNCATPIVVFDEVHQLRDPARVLKVGAAPEDPRHGLLHGGGDEEVPGCPHRPEA
ncbi:MAG: AAA family ATPase [Candidatus Sericytochromatia bacterium]|nr:AAA family ATPase [Candidatus Tanganyikabacteria bacterium]